MKRIKNLSECFARIASLGFLVIVLVMNVGMLPAMATLQIEEGQPEQNQSQTESLPGSHTANPMVVDAGELLTDGEEVMLEDALQDICNKWDIDVAVITTDTLYGLSPMEFTDNYYDGYEYAENGCMLMVSMEERDYWLSTSGNMIDALTDMGIDFICDAVAEHLSDGDYYGAFMQYGTMVDSFVDEYRNGGSAYDIDNLPDDDDYGFEYDGGYSDIYEQQKPGGFRGFLLGIGGAIGALVSSIIMAVHKAQIENVKPQNGARDYLKRETVSMYHKSDRFLYNQVARTPKPKPQDKSDSGGYSGGSSIHTSSGGSTHGGGGGKF